MDSDPLAISVKKREILFMLLMRSRKAALKGEQYVEGELSKLDIIFICVMFWVFSFFMGLIHCGFWCIFVSNSYLIYLVNSLYIFLMLFRIYCVLYPCAYVNF